MMRKRMQGPTCRAAFRFEIKLHALEVMFCVRAHNTGSEVLLGALTLHHLDPDSRYRLEAMG